MIDAMTVKMMTAAALAVSGAAAGQYQASQLTKREEMIAEAYQQDASLSQ